MKADHFAFLVSNMDKAIDFYCNSLGLKLLSRDLDEEHAEEFSFIELNGCNIELLRMLNRNEEIPINIDPNLRSNCPHIAINSNNLDDLVEDLKKSDIPILKGPLLIPNKVKWLYIEDPDKNIIEFVEWL